MEDLVVRPAEVFREKLGVDLRLRHRATRIDREEKRVIGVDALGEEFICPYDKLLIATGAEPTVPDIPGRDIPGVKVIKNLEHGRAFKEYLQGNTVSRAVILGMGYVAMEMAEALKDLGIEVCMVKPRERILPWLQEDLAAMVRRELEDKGVRLYTGQAVRSIEGREGALRVRGSDLDLDCELVLVATGIKPCSELAETAGLELGPAGAVATDRAMCTSDPDIFAAGDCADAYHVVTGKKTWIPLALWANRSGRAVADSMLGKEVRLSGVAGTAVFKVFDLEVARTGLNASEAASAGFDPVEQTVESVTRAHSYAGGQTIKVSMVGDRGSGRLLGAQAVAPEGAAHRINGPAVALLAGMEVAEYAEGDLAYAPPFGPTWDPTLIAAARLLKKMKAS
jgi:NADPH-dependent 2,4-dienoyl-CoA reductase/sulfur reductase-like enzyme